MTTDAQHPARPASAPVAVVTPRPAVLRLSYAVAVLAVAAASTGLLWPADTATTAVTTVHGEEVRLFAEGIYRHDSVFKAAANRGSDLVTLVVAVPLLILALRSCRRRSLHVHHT